MKHLGPVDPDKVHSIRYFGGSGVRNISSRKNLLPGTTALPYFSDIRYAAPPVLSGGNNSETALTTV